MTHEYIEDADELSGETRTFLFDRAGGIGGIGEMPVCEWIEMVLAEMREDHTEDCEVSDTAI